MQIDLTNPELRVWYCTACGEPYTSYTNTMYCAVCRAVCDATRYRYGGSGGPYKNYNRWSGLPEVHPDEMRFPAVRPRPRQTQRHRWDTDRKVSETMDKPYQPTGNEMHRMGMGDFEWAIYQWRYGDQCTASPEAIERYWAVYEFQQLARTVTANILGTGNKEEE